MNQDSEDKGIHLSDSPGNLSTQKKYERERIQRSSRSFRSQTPKVIELVMKYSGGYIKDKKQASYVVWGFIVITLIVSFSLFFGGSGIEQVDIQDIPVDQR